MVLKQIRETFLDGVLDYGTYQTQRSPTRKDLGKTFVSVGRLFYRKLAVRESDYLLQNQVFDQQIDLKVKTVLPPSLRTIDKQRMKVQIGADLYDIIQTDRDTSYLYFYLHKIGDDPDE